MTEPAPDPDALPPGALVPDCDDQPKLTAEEWAYIEAMSGEEGER